MRHYEIVLLVHPDQSDQVGVMTERYRTLIKEAGGVIHRLEDWGMRKLAYCIKGNYKAHYILMNIECSQETLSEFQSIFRFSDAVLRNLIIKQDEAITSPSPLLESAGAENPDAAPRDIVPTAIVNKDKPAPDKNDKEKENSNGVL